MKFDIFGLVKNMKAMQDKIETISSEGSAGGGMVTAVVNGKNELLSVKISDEAWLEIVRDNDRAMLEALIVAAINDAMHRNIEQMSQEFGKMAGTDGLPSIPGLTDLFKQG
jgi:DNA-binding YbaB/EbfC family protein